MDIKELLPTMDDKLPPREILASPELRAAIQDTYWRADVTIEHAMAELLWVLGCRGQVASSSGPMTDVQKATLEGLGKEFKTESTADGVRPMNVTDISKHRTE